MTDTLRALRQDRTSRFAWIPADIVQSILIPMVGRFASERFATETEREILSYLEIIRIHEMSRSKYDFGPYRRMPTIGRISAWLREVDALRCRLAADDPEFSYRSVEGSLRLYCETSVHSKYDSKACLPPVERHLVQFRQYVTSVSALRAETDVPRSSVASQRSRDDVYP